MKNKLALYNLKMLKKLRELIPEFMDVYIVFLDTEGNFITPNFFHCTQIAKKSIYNWFIFFVYFNQFNKKFLKN
jgi:hypothetical protein